VVLCRLETYIGNKFGWKHKKILETIVLDWKQKMTLETIFRDWKQTKKHWKVSNGNNLFRLETKSVDYKHKN